MRVIAGSKRRLLLKTIESDGTRPTTDRIKETLFNMINEDVYDATFLDLFAGSGQIGIEALSRGAKSAVFVENNRDAISCIEENLKHTDFLSLSKVMKADVLTAISQLSGQHFDLVFMDPPYNKGFERATLLALKEKKLVNADSLIIIEADKHDDFTYVEEIGYQIRKEKIYKTNKHIFVQLGDI